MKADHRDSCPVVSSLKFRFMIVEKILTSLPPWVTYEGINFELRLFSNGTDEIRLYYAIHHVDTESAHFDSIEAYGCWENPFYLEGPSNTGFLYLVEGIENDEQLIAAIDETRAFLLKHSLLTNP